jgi:DNA-binding GntR family transcriptional regulator
MPMRQPLQRTVTEQVYEQVRDSIRGGALVPGQRIDQAGLARRYGTSIVPVREALARLQADGLVRIVAHRGAFVEQMSPDVLIDIYSMRELLEEDATRIAAPNLGEAELTRLGELLTAMDTATAGEDYAALFELNREFHFTIYRAARRAHLLQIITQLWDQGDHYRRIYTELPERARMAQAEHRAIVEACRRRDPDAMGITVRHHVHQTTVGLLEQQRATPRVQELRNDDRAA